jgi:nucleoside-diphosphate-sugar epimerase
VNVAIAGAHGQTALRLTRLLVANGERVIGLIRNPDHASDVSDAGASPVLCDLEHATVDEIALAIDTAEAIVFAAGSGADGGAARTLSVDRDAAIKLLGAATIVGAPRYLMISGAGPENPPSEDLTFEVYLRAKAEADAELAASDREWTIVRPGRLTNDPGTGYVRIDAAPFAASVPRDDVASLLALLLADARSARRILYINSGSQPLQDALGEILGRPARPHAGAQRRAEG